MKSLSIDTQRELVEALFPKAIQESDGSWTDGAADTNLDAVIIDMEMHGGDKVCIASLKRILEQLSEARRVLAKARAEMGGET